MLVKNKDKKAADPRPHIIEDIASTSSKEKAVFSTTMVLVSVITGFIVGLAVWAVFLLSKSLTNLLWHDAYNAIAASLANIGLGSWWLPLAICLIGGVIIGLFTWTFGGAPEELESVMAQVKKTGGYHLQNPLASIFGFLLPLVFGGSIGPEAGLTGIIAAACTKVGSILKKTGLQLRGLAEVTTSAALSAIFASPFMGVLSVAEDGMADDADDPAQYNMRRKVKLVLYTASALGAIGGIKLLTSIFGSEGGLPYFEGFAPSDINLAWFFPCVALGYLGAFLFFGGTFVCKRISGALGDRKILKPVIAGLILGLIAIPLPLVLFPGEDQSFELMATWQTYGFGVLIATGLLKCLATPLCLEFGWHGGHFFPLIFAGVAMGYGVALFSGVDAMFCVAVCTATTMAATMRKPLVALALLLMCFPPSSLLWMGLACLAGSIIPLPAGFLNHESAPEIKE